jgi:hypothetical protein
MLKILAALVEVTATYSDGVSFPVSTPCDQSTHMQRHTSCISKATASNRVFHVIGSRVETGACKRYGSTGFDSYSPTDMRSSTPPVPQRHNALELKKINF